MNLLLILFILPAFGRPSSDQLDVGAEIDNQLEIFTNFNNETGKILLNSTVVENVVKMLLEAERNILKMNAELKAMENQEIQFKENYFPTYNKAKSYLRETRQGLRKLADRTVTDVRDLKDLLEGLDKTNDFIFLKLSIDKMKNLMIETLKTLQEAKEKYNSALKAFDNLKSAIRSQNIQLTKMVTETSEEYEAWVAKSGIAYRTVAGPGGILTTTACIFLDVLGALGICSAINAALIGTIVPTVEAQIAGKIEKYRAEFEKMRDITDRMLESGDNFDAAIKVAIDVLNDEIDLIGVWNQRAKTVNRNIEQYPAEFLTKFKSFRTIFINGLDDLDNAAKKFLAQPKDILRLTD